MRCGGLLRNRSCRKGLPALLSLCHLVLTGCVAPYSETSAYVQSSYRAGNLDQAIQGADSLESQARNRPLGKLEKGNLLLSAGRVEESGETFASLIEPMVQEQDNRPVISFSGLGGQIGASTFGDDRSMTYRVQGYELVIAMQYRAFTFLLQGNLDSAVVEMRRAARIQESIRDAYQEETGSTGADRAVLEDRVAEVMSRMGSLLGEGGNSWSNAGVWWLSGVLREAAGEPSVAQIDFQRAFELQPNNPVFLQELMRILQDNDPSRFRDLAAQYPQVSQALPPAEASSSVVVVYEEGLSPLLIPDTFFLIWPGAHSINISVPLMTGAPYRPGPARIRAEQVETGMQGATSIQSLSAHALQERMPGIMWRNILRNVSRATLNEASEEANDNWETAIKLVLILKGAMEQADTRSWSTLPLGMQAGRLWLTPGSHQLWVDTPGGTKGPFSFQLEPGQTGFILLRDTGGYSAWYQTRFPGGGAARFGTGSPAPLSDSSVPNPN